MTVKQIILNDGIINYVNIEIIFDDSTIYVQTMSDHGKKGVL